MVIVMIKEQGTKIFYKNKEAPWTVEKKITLDTVACLAVI